MSVSSAGLINVIYREIIVLRALPNEVKILDFEGNLFKRELSEMINIYLNDSINFRTDTNNRRVVYIIIY